jgi:hypothetical protein
VCSESCEVAAVNTDKLNPEHSLLMSDEGIIQLAPQGNHSMSQETGDFGSSVLGQVFLD